MVDATPILHWIRLPALFQNMLKRIDKCQDQQKYCRGKHDAEDPLKVNKKKILM